MTLPIVSMTRYLKFIEIAPSPTKEQEKIILEIPRVRKITKYKNQAWVLFVNDDGKEHLVIDQLGSLGFKTL